MANQIIIDIGAVANDGTGDPLRTAFNYVNDNFSNVWASGVANSNIGFSGNKILTTNTNGNLILAPNGIGKVQSNVDIRPNANNTLSLGTSDLRWNSVYTQNLDVGGNVSFNNVTVGGNLTVQGNIIQVGNIVTETLTIQLGNAAVTANSANGAGITVGANDNIATLLYNSSSNVWTTNIGITASGNVAGTYFIGNGSQLTGISSYSNTNATSLLAAFGSNSISTTGNIAAGYLFGNGSQLTGISTVSLGNLEIIGSAIKLADGSSNTSVYLTANGVSGNAYISIPSNPTTLADGLSIVNLNGRVEIKAKDGAAAQSWYFQEDGTLQLPGNVESHISSDSSIHIQTAGSEHWVFGTDNVFTTPGNIIPDTSNAYSLGNATNQWKDLWVSNSTIYMNSVPVSLTAGNVLTVNGADVVTTAANGESSIGNLDILGTTISIASGAPETYINLSASVQGFAYVQVPTDATANISNVRIHNDAGNIEFGTGDFSTGETNYTWNFNRDGGTIYPTLTVTRGDRTGTLTGQTLLFGDATQEALISTPDGNDTDGTSSQRLVINPGKGADGSTGEGGDIYLYAGRGGDAGGSGGDIKIRGGLGPVDGAGGYITMEGGEADVNGVGGYIEIYGGVSGNSNGGYLDLQGGLGQTEGGAVFIQGGQGQAGPGGPVNITGGVSGLGLAEYGNVGVIAGASSWVFDNTGNLTLPNDGVVYETNIPFGGLSGKTIALKPYGGTDADQQLLVYPTAVADFNHLHLTSGNLWNTELFLGNDDFYVKLANTGNIVINANDNTGNTAQWTFGTEGTILNSGNLTLQTPSGIPASLSNWQGGGGWNQGFYGNLATTGGTGTGLTVDVAAGGGGYISINEITINTPGTGYTDGDVITIDNENNIPGTFTISVTSNGWTFDNTGVLTVPGNIVMPPGSSLVGNGASPAPSISGFSNGEFGGNVSVTGNISGGNISISTGGNITGNTAGYAIGYRDIPQVSFTGNTTIATTDAGKHFYSTQSSNYILTIANNASQGFQVGAAITVVNQGTGTISIAQGSGVLLYLAGNASSGNRSVATFGMATIMKVATDTWFINGTGVS